MPSWVWSDNLTGIFLPLDQGFTVELLLILLEGTKKKKKHLHKILKYILIE